MRKEEKKGKSRIGLTVVALALFFCVILSATIAAGAMTVVKVDPPTQTVTAGQSFSVDVRVEGVTYMGDDEADLYFDPGAMQVVGIEEGVFLKSGGTTYSYTNIDNTNGIATFAYTLIPPDSVSGSGVLATIYFDTKPAAAPGEYDLDLGNGHLSAGDGISEITGVEWRDGTVTIQPIPVPGLSRTGMIAAIGMLAFVLVISSARRKRRE